MDILNKQSAMWNYIGEDVKGLLVDGEYLIKYSPRSGVSDYSFLVFPFSKAYEGFLKKFFLDLDLITQEEYFSDNLRIGRVLNPEFIKKRFSVYRKLLGRRGTEGVAERLWAMWKKGRNLVFHYFPHNFRRLSYKEAVEIIEGIVTAMSEAVTHCHL